MRHPPTTGQGSGFMACRIGGTHTFMCHLCKWGFKRTDYVRRHGEGKENTAVGIG